MRRYRSGPSLWVALASLTGSTLFAALSALTPTAPNLWPLLGVASLLGLVICCTSVAATILARPRPSHRDAARLALALVLLIAASFHLLLLGEHAEESPLLGLGFLASGVIQLGLATVVVLHPQHAAYPGGIAHHVTLIGLEARHFAGGP